MKDEIDVLFTPYQMGKFTLKNRIVLPPMTRARAAEGNVPTGMMAAYYVQRCGAGLLITEGANINSQAQGYAWTPGIHTLEQIEGWRKVTDAVHNYDTPIFLQLWHVGRISHTSLQPNQSAPVSASALKAKGAEVFIADGGSGARYGKKIRVATSEPRAMTIDEIKKTEADYRQAAQNAIDAGFDGVEIHAANGYLINQFINSASNHRNDEYGGSIENRLRFLREITEGICNQIGKDRVGVRLSPFRNDYESIDETPSDTYLEAAHLLNDLGILYLHLSEPDKESGETPEAFYDDLRVTFNKTIILAGGFDKKKAIEAIKKNHCDLVGFGRAFIANPDLPFRLHNDTPLNNLDIHTLYGGTDKGYIDYPFVPQF